MSAWGKGVSFTSIVIWVCVSGAALAQSPIGSLGPPLSASCQQSEARRKVGSGLLLKKDYDGAIRQFASALKLCPGNESAALDLTRAYLETRRFADAEQSAKSILAEDPQSEGGQLMLAYSEFMERKFPQAGKRLQKLLKEDPNNADAHKLIGLTLFFYKRYSMAEQQLQDALRLHPGDEGALYSLGRIYYTQNKFPPAIDAFQRLIALDPDNYKAYNNLGLCFQAVRKNHEAEAAFERAQQLARREAPADDWPYANLAAMLLKEDRAGDALPYLQEAIRINPKSSRDLCLLGQALLSEGRLHQALSYLQNSAKLDASYAKPHYLLGQVYEKLHNTQKAQQQFDLFQDLTERNEIPQPAAMEP